MRVLLEATELAGRIRESPVIVAFTGAGISQASGLPLFSSIRDGLPLSEWLTPTRFHRDPRAFYAMFWREMCRWPLAEPNPAHRALAALGVLVVTQNFDGLQQKAGSRRVLELHGNLRSLRCEDCLERYPCATLYGNPEPRCSSCGSILRPDLVMAGEPVPNWWAAVHTVEHCSLLLVIGTSLDYAPVGRLPELAERAGAQVAVVNRDAEILLPEAVGILGLQLVQPLHL